MGSIFALQDSARHCRQPGSGNICERHPQASLIANIKMSKCCTRLFQLTIHSHFIALNFSGKDSNCACHPSGYWHPVDPALGTLCQLSDLSSSWWLHFKGWRDVMLAQEITSCSQFLPLILWRKLCPFLAFSSKFLLDPLLICALFVPRKLILPMRKPMEQQLELHLCMSQVHDCCYVPPTPTSLLIQGHNARKMHGQVAHGERLQVRDLLLGKWRTCYEYL